MAKKQSNEIRNAETKTTTVVDPDDGFKRTALVIEDRNTGSVDVVDKDGRRLCQINISFSPNAENSGEEWFNVDVIDVDGRFARRRALAFAPGKRVDMAVPEGGNLVATEFSGKPKK